MKLRKIAVAWCVAVLIASASAGAQDFRGRINGTVTDNTGAVLPGVTVTASSPALIQPQVQVSGAEGDYRFVALPPGVYDITFELAGFQTIKREGIRVVINQTLTVDQQLQIATLQETVTVSGDSPIVDTSTTQVGTNFTKELLTEIPNARDIWAAMAQAPGIQMTQFDVGGSRTGTQTGFLTYGFGDQNQTKLEGIDTTEGTAANAGYFDFGSFEEFQVGGAGSGADSFGGGTNMSITVKSGGDRFSGNWYSDWEGDSTISDNVPDAFRTANTRDEDGFFVTQALDRGNPIDRQYDINFNLGGPLYKGRAWFFLSYRLNDQYKFSLGSDVIQRSKLTNPYTLKGTFQLNRNNQFIAFLNKREKLQELRDFAPPLVPITAGRYQSSRNYPWKVQWTSVLGSRAFLDVIGGNWYNFFPLRPTDDYGFASNVPPGRIDTGTNQRTGYHDSYQDQKRYKPQVYVAMSYFQDSWHGSHDFKIGYDWKREQIKFFRDQPGGNIFYRDLNTNVNELELYNAPNQPINEVLYNAGFISDTWKFNDRLTFNLGMRMEHYVDSYPDQSFTPGGHAALANWPADLNPTERTRYLNLIAPVSVAGREVARTFNISPRLGFAYDLSGDNRTVLKGYFGRFYYNSADEVANRENPVGSVRLRYQFLDQNGNRHLDGPQELGAFRSTQGTAAIEVDDDINRPYSQEISSHLEREIVTGLSGRVSYVYKSVRNEWVEIDPTRQAAMTIPFPYTDPGADNVLGTSDDQQLMLTDRPANTPQTRLYTNPTDPSFDSDFHTVEFAVNRRFTDRWMVLTSVGYTWLSQFSNTTTATGALDSVNHARQYNWRPSQRLYGDEGKELATLWNYKIIGRYLFAYDIGFSGSLKVQSGRQWGRNSSIVFPGDGQQTVRVEPVTANRAPMVSILDLRVDKSFSFGRYGRVTGMVDLFNALNSGAVLNFTTVTGANFKRVIGILDPRIVRFGVRYDF